MQNKTLELFYFIRFGVYIIYLNRLHMFWYCLMFVSKKISLMYIFDKLNWAAIGFSSVSYYHLLVWKRIKFYAIYDDVFAQLNKPIPIS